MNPVNVKEHCEEQEDFQVLYEDHFEDHLRYKNITYMNYTAQDHCLDEERCKSTVYL